MPTSPASDDRLWKELRELAADARPERGPDAGKRLREAARLLNSGFESVISSVSHLRSVVDTASIGARDLAKPSLRDVLKEGIQAAIVYGTDEPEPKRTKCNSESTEENDEEDQKSDDMAKMMCASMASKASWLSKELKKVKGELIFMQNRCAHLEEENRRLRDEGLEGSEDDLVRLQLEALLAEKSKLANENDKLMRENACLQQEVEYHRIANHELSEIYEDTIPTRLDFSPFADAEEDDESWENVKKSPPPPLITNT